MTQRPAFATPTDADTIMMDRPFPSRLSVRDFDTAVVWMVECRNWWLDLASVFCDMAEAGCPECADDARLALAASDTYAP